MADVIVFGGTTEGRELAEWLTGRGADVLVSVATPYGKQVLEESARLQGAELAGSLREQEEGSVEAGQSTGFWKSGQGGRCFVHTGRLDAEGMRALIMREHPKLVADATHPHAQEVTRAVKQACQALSVPCIRIVRGRQQADGPADGIWVDTPQQAAEILHADDSAVLLTTGSKELNVFTSDPNLKRRLFARVLPDSKVLAACEALGLRGRQLIAMQGPFSVEMNCSLLRAVNAGWMVTKESGSSGGFEEKREASRICGVRLIIIRRPHENEDGLTLEEAKHQIAKTLDICKGHMPERTVAVSDSSSVIQIADDLTGHAVNASPDNRVRDERELCLIGMGMGAGSQLTLESLEALKESDAVLGAPRMLQDIRRWTAGKVTEPVYMGRDILEWVEKNPQYHRICAVFSGDTGFYSASDSLIRLMHQKDCGQAGASSAAIRICPGISTVSCLCARFQIPWEDMYLASAHGRECDVVRLCAGHSRVFLLLGGECTIRRVCSLLTEAGCGRTRVYAGIRLGYPEEQLLQGIAEQFQETDADGLAAVILEQEKGA